MDGGMSPLDRPPPAAPIAFTARLIRLQALAHRLEVKPVHAVTTGVSFQPFPLPRLPLSTLAWCGSATGQFYLRNRRCLSVVLLLDRLMRRWVPFLPTQNCGHQSTSWSLIDCDYIHLPEHILIAGSFQTIRSGDVFAAHGLIPPFDGVHAVEEVVRSKQPWPPHSWLFLRSRGLEAELLADPAALLIEDVDAALRDATDRLHILPRL